MLRRVLKILLVCVVLVALATTVVGASLSASPGNYNRGEARNWADSWCRRRHDTYNCGFASDCQNFMSQVLRAGGLTDLKGPDRWDCRFWWFDSCYSWEHSASWDNCGFFDDHCWSQYGTRYVKRSSLSGGMYIGDIILSKEPGSPDWDHTSVYMGWGRAQEGTKKGENCHLRSAHTKDRCRCWVYDFYPEDTQFRYWSVVW